MNVQEVKRKRQELFEKLDSKYEEIRAYRKAHSPEERNGQEFKAKMMQYRRELRDFKIEIDALRAKRIAYKEKQH